MTSKTVLITGCSEGGIGSALALAFQAHGLHVFATTRSLPKMAHLSKFPNITLLSLDVTSSSDISAAVNAVKFHPGNNGKLDYLINNAGRNFFMPTLDIDIAEAKKIYETKFWGPLALIKAFAPLVIKAKGTIVNNCSISGHVNVPFMGMLKSFCFPAYTLYRFATSPLHRSSGTCILSLTNKYIDCRPLFGLQNLS